MTTLAPPSGLLLADTLGIEMLSKDNKMWGAAARAFPFLEFSHEVWVQAHSDLVTEKRSAAWVSLSPRVWLYVITSMKVSYILVFDADHLGMKFNTIANDFGGETVKDTVIQIAKGVRAIFEFCPGSQTWEPIEAGKSVYDLVF